MCNFASPAIFPTSENISPDKQALDIFDAERLYLREVLGASVDIYVMIGFSNPMSIYGKL
jgi:hypothetical protein